MKFKRQIASLILILFFTIPLFGRNVRIRLLNKHHPKTIEVLYYNGKLLVDNDFFNYNGNFLIQLYRKKIIIKLKKKKIVTSTIMLFSDSLIFLQLKNKKKIIKRGYKNSIEFSQKKNELVIINSCDMEWYVHQGALAELGHLARKKRSKELISAMEVVLRSYVIAYWHGRHGKKNYQFCDLTHCFHFIGLVKKSPILTKGQILFTPSGKVLKGFFHSSCGGLLSSPSIFWKGITNNGAYRVGPDSLFMDGEASLCKKSPQFNWSVVVSKRSLSQGLHYNINKILCNYKEGRVTSLTITGKNFNKKISITKFMSKMGHLLGWAAIKSNNFIIMPVKNGYRFIGHGLGHGIGLCQWGAAKIAQRGYSYKFILNHYFPKCKLGQINEK